MGIKGIYNEIGAGRRVSLCKLAVEKLEETGRPLRIAIDISIWQFQVQAAKGGPNPAIRTLFFRLVRLLSHSIQPIFVFDGPNKPAFKRNKRTGRGDVVATAMAKRMVRLFGFQAHDAPGEAEAECALLQRQGIVDAVLSEDVDTIMFGCTQTLRNWSAEGPKGSKTPTHVSLYDTKELEQSGETLDREGMVLVALMSGGDYIPEGIPRCGVKVACEAAHAGFGKSLCRLKKSDTGAIAVWRDSLIHELRSNESGFFRTRHKALTIPDTFPNLDVLRYYTHPVVSSSGTIELLREEFPSERPVDIVGLREFSKETFDWVYKTGAVKFTRVMATGMLVQRLLNSYAERDSRPDDPTRIQEIEEGLVEAISKRRTHFSTDAMPELRVSYIPASAVGLDLGKEPEEVVTSYGRDGLALNSDDEFDDQADEDTEMDAAKGGAKKAFDPLQPNAAWVPESIVKLGIPLTVETWEEHQRAKELAKLEPKASKRTTKKTGMAPGALDKWVSVTKGIADPGCQKPPVNFEKALPSGAPAAPSPKAGVEVSRPRLESQMGGKSTKPPSLPATTSKPKSTTTKGASAAAVVKPTAQTNPWTLAAISQTSPRITTKPHDPTDPIIISSSPSGPLSPSASSPLRRTQGPLAENSFSDDPFASSPTTLVRQQESPTPSARAGRESQSQISKGRRIKKPAPPSSQQTRQASITAFGRLTKASAVAVTSKDSPVPSSHRGSGDQTDGWEGIPLKPGFTPSDKVISRPSGHSSPGDTNMADEDPFSSPGPYERPRGRAYIAAERKPPTEPGKGPREKTPLTRIYVPLAGDVGYFGELEVSREEADRIISKKASIYRRSEISIVDLTGED